MAKIPHLVSFLPIPYPPHHRCLGLTFSEDAAQAKPLGVILGPSPLPGPTIISASLPISEDTTLITTVLHILPAQTSYPSPYC